jgi:hypothetical protein
LHPGIGFPRLQARHPALPLSRRFPRERFDPTRDASRPSGRGHEVRGASGKNIVLDVGGEWCPWCVFMDKFFYMNPDIDKLREAMYVWVKVNFSKENENKEFLSVYPEAAVTRTSMSLDPPANCSSRRTRPNSRWEKVITREICRVSEQMVAQAWSG